MEYKKLGVANLKIVIAFFIAIAIQVDKMKSDKLSRGDLLKLIFFVLFNNGLSAFNSFLEAGKEVLDLDEEEKQEINVYFKSEFELESEETEAIVESVFSILLSVFSFILKIRSMFSNKDTKKASEKLEKVLS